MSILNDYFARIYCVLNYLTTNKNNKQNKQILIIDTIKCTIIGAAFAALLRYSRG